MTQHTLFVCVLCRFSSIEQQQAGLSAGQSLFNQLSEELASCKGFAIIQIYQNKCNIKTIQRVFKARAIAQRNESMQA